MLLDSNRTLKIADFGVARVEAQNPRDMTGETGTLGYMAPEVCSFVLLLSQHVDYYTVRALSFDSSFVIYTYKKI